MFSFLINHRSHERKILNNNQQLLSILIIQNQNAKGNHAIRGSKTVTVFLLWVLLSEIYCKESSDAGFKICIRGLEICVFKHTKRARPAAGLSLLYKQSKGLCFSMAILCIMSSQPILFCF